MKESLSQIWEVKNFDKAILAQTDLKPLKMHQAREQQHAE